VAERRLLRVCTIGAECTGKTTLARELGEFFDAPVVEEFGRDYFADKLARGDATVFPGDVIRVIAEQSRREDAVAQSAESLMICDTDVFTVAIWHERYLGGRRPEIDQLAQMRIEQGAGMDLYLLCLPDFPFVPDAVRTGEPLRTAMHEVFVERLEATSAHYVTVEGSAEQRLKLSVEAIQNLLDAHGE
jgi:NadR type nicotinamide-nucleotide adenylyltransferase